MVYCTTCGSQIAAGGFCTNCGTAAAPAPAAIQPTSSTNVLSIVALVTSLLGISLAGVICGHIALNQIKRTREQGHGMALAGVIVGYVGIAVSIIAIGIWIAVVVGMANYSYTNY